MALEFLMRRRSVVVPQDSYAPDPFPLEPNPEGYLQPEEPPEVVGDEGGGGISAGGSCEPRQRRPADAADSAG